MAEAVERKHADSDAQAPGLTQAEASLQKDADDRPLEGAGSGAPSASLSPEQQAARDAACFRKLHERAEAGDREAMYLVGVCYARGKGVDIDYNSAAEWFKKATVLGHSKAKVSLGYCYAAGKGVKRDLEVAYILLREAADAGDRDAFELSERVAQRLHAEQIARCEKKIRQRRILRKAQKGRIVNTEEEIALEIG
jgi:TPR repeat protein